MAPNSKSKGGKGSGSAEEPRLVLHQSDHFYESKTKKFHDFLTLEWPATRKVMTVHVGDTLALKYSKARLTTGTWAPFEVPWSAAQVLAIYFTTDDHEYHMIVRWFYRYHEVHSKWDRNLFPKAFQENSIVLESSKVDEHVPMDSVLGRVVLTSSEGNSGIGKKYTRKAWKPVPQVGLECRGYFNFTNKKFQLVDDWDHCGDDDDDEDVTAAAIDASYEISTPFLYRGISCLDEKYRTQLKKHYMNNIAKRRDLVQQQLERAVKKPASKKRASSASSATTLKRTKASAKVEKKGEPVGSDPSSEEEEESVEFLQDALYMSKAKGIEYYYKIRLETSGAIFQVGDLVAVYWKYPDSKTKKTKKNKRWLPFDRQWAAAQILSLERPRERNNDESSCPQMKIRWFSKLSDLSKKMKQDIRAKGMDIGELDVFETTELVECPISSILGSIDMVDRTQCSRKQPPVPLQGSLAVGLPRAQRTCRYSIEKDALVGVCWDTYKSTHLSDPLKRGLKRLHHTLREKTIAAIEHHPSESDESSAMDLDDDDDTSEAAFEQANPTIRPTGEIKTADNRRYYSSVSVPVQIGKCASRFVTKTRSENWELSVGDVVCVEKDNAELPTQGAFGRWQPYEVPWTCCQILSIYSHTSGMDDLDNDDNGGVDEDVFLEVRWFPRASGIDTPELEEMQVSSANEEEIFEAFLVSMDVSAASILGRVNLKLGHHRQSGDPKSASSTIPTVDRRCKSLYFDRERRTQPMFCSDHRPTEWHQRLVERGLKVSKILQADNDLENKVVERFGRKNSENLYADLQECVVSQRENIEGPNLWSDVSSALLLQTTIQPQWHYYAEVDKVCHVNDRSSQLWTIKVGDIIGCQKEDAPVPFAFRNTDNPWFPYTVEWSPCQIIAIYRSKGRTSFEVRWLHIAPGDDNVNQSSSYDIIYETTLPATTTTNMTEEAIIGPLTVIPLTQRASVPFLPLSIHTYGGERPANRAAGEAISFAAMVERGIQASTCYGSRIHWRQVLGKVLHLHQSIDDDDDDDGDLITANFETSLSTSKANARDDQTNVTDTFAAFARENSTSDRVEAVENQSISRSILSRGDRSREASSVKKDLQSLLDADNRISTINAPFHVDKSALRAYFTEMAIEPPYEQYSICGEKESKDWIVQLGDIVTVDFVHGSGGTMFDINVAQSATHSPYFRPWAVAEIVAIWRVYETKKDLSNAINRSGANLKGARPARGDLELEIRWVWRKCELQGRMKKQKPSLNEIEELFETDNIDSCTAVSLLGPVKICSSKDEVSPPLYHLGMPVPQFYCSQFWSLHRRRSIPVPSIDGMKGRARMYSPCFTKDNALRRKLTHLENKRDHTTADVDTSLPAWKGGFQMVIDRLSIAQTLDEGNFGNGVTLIGRQHEQEVLTSFLRTSIRAAHGETNGSGGTVCPSLFVAGPPGTGKSACVFSIVGKLSVEQVKGKLPDFDFVSLNGMEMRHPFEAYVKFWEAISGNVKERLSPELAAVKLERYFTGKIVKDAPKRSVVVLLLDEIDYLVSRKETVLYNFFDWPKRSFDMPKSPRLIVIGISNTMNLPSRLKPSVSSRLGSSRCDFKAYNENEFVTILTSKIQPEKTNYPVFSKDAIIFAARKIGSRTGDLRQALQICKAAAESVLQELEKGTRKDKRAQHQPMVQVRDVANIFRERTGAVISQAITASAPLEVLLLIALAALTQHTGRQGFDIAEVMTKTDSISNSCGIPMYHPPPSFSELLDMLNRLAEARLVRLYTERSSMTTFRAPLGGSGGAWPSIALNVDFTDILAALRSTQHDQLAQKQLGGFSL